MNLLMDYRRKHYPDRKIGIFHQDFEAQYTVTTEYIERTMERYKDEAELYWVCLPMATRTALSSYEMYWYPWHATWLFHYDYNKLYDLYYKAGLKPSQMRVASPFNDYSKDALNMYRVIDPQIWVRLVGRVRGANFGAIYGRSKAMGYRSVRLPEGHTWKSYTMFLLDTLPTRLRNNYVKKFNASIQFWHKTGGGLDEETIQELIDHGYRIKRNGVSNYTLNKKSRIIFLDKIPDNTDDIATTKDIPSWKRMCCCILKNDHICRTMGFGMTREQQRRIDAIQKKYKSIEEMNYGV